MNQIARHHPAWRGAASGRQTYRYKAMAAGGRIVAGSLEAETRDMALGELERLALMPIELGLEAADDAPRMRETAWRRAVSAPAVTIATEDLSILLSSGMTLDKALTTLASAGGQGALAATMRALSVSVRSGERFADALARHPKLFPPAYVSMVAIAEANGRLSETLSIIARERKRAEELRRRISSSLAYPLFVLFAATGVLVFVLTAVVPEFERALMGFDADPAEGRSLIFAASEFLRVQGTWLAVAVLAVALIAILARRSEAVRALAATTVRRLPVLREIARVRQTVVIASSVSSLLKSGVGVVSALQLTGDLLPDRAARHAMHEAVGAVRQGATLAEAMKQQGLLPLYAQQMLSVGEEAGALAGSLERIAQIYETKLGTAVDRFAGIVGPATLLLVSMIIGWIILSVIGTLLRVNDLLILGGVANGQGMAA